MRRRSGPDESSPRPRSASPAPMSTRAALRLAMPLLVSALACSTNSPIGPGTVVSVRITPATLVLDAGQTTTVRAFPLDADSALVVGKTIRWSTSDSAVVTVDDTGFVRSIGLGNATIAATTQDGITGNLATVVSLPSIAFSDSTIDFGSFATGPNPAAQVVAVTSERGSPLAGISVGAINYQSGAGWLSAVLDSGTAPATLTLQATTGALTAGMYTATVPLASAAAGNSPLSLTVTFTVNPAGPAIGLAPSAYAVNVSLGAADPAPQVINVTNAGGSTLDQLTVGTIAYGAGASGWVSGAGLSGTTAPATVTVQVHPGALAAGTYTATIPISSVAATNTPQSISVTLNVLAVSFATDVQPIFSANCLGCHFVGGQVPNLTAGSSYAAIVGVISGSVSCTGNTYVVAGNAATSLVYAKVIASAPPCGGHMPPGGQLSSGNLQTIADWINAGAPNN
ncbi:MAG: Ig-like domain-containing protein [Gemmatimonadota bacterium]